MDPPTRRQFLSSTGVATTAGIAGCLDVQEEADEVDTVPGSKHPAIDEWLTETTVGAAADTYDGTILDWTGRNAVTIDVGAPGNGGPFAFDPPAVVVTLGTDVRFSWTGDGNPHNVDADPDEQIGRSNYTFTSGEPVDGEGVKYTISLNKEGTANYHCDRHLDVGMKGGIAVE